MVKKFAISLELNLHHIYIYDESIDLIQTLEINLDHLSMVQSQENGKLEIFSEAICYYPWFKNYLVNRDGFCS